MNTFRDYDRWPRTLEPGDDFVNEFLVPGLARAIRYDRLAGFFSSSSLVVAAKGLEHLLQVPRERWPAYCLIVCEQLSEDDAAAIQQGIAQRALEDRLTERMQRALDDPPSTAASDRLGLLAALVALGFAEIRVAVPKGPDGRPRAGAIEHAKAAILHDAEGDVLVGFGSANESWHGWIHNNEQLDIYRSWDESVWAWYGRSKVERFERIWEGRDSHTLTVDLPRAVRASLIRFAQEPLPADLFPPLGPAGERLLDARAEATVLQFIRDAPRLSTGRRLAITTAAVDAWPHQVGIFDVASEQEAPRFLLCDEVGLGKTAEAAFIIRQLKMEGRAHRVLLLVPFRLLHQWQDELREKFNLSVPIYDGSHLILPQPTISGTKQRQPVQGTTLFSETEIVVLAGSQMMRRESRARDILDCPAWDVVILDEAHHARRKGFARPEPPNLLLEMMQALCKHTRSLLLLTATPMQIDPQELWDLLRLLGLDEPFANSYANFRAFYEALGRLGRNPDELRFLFEEIAARCHPDPELERLVQAEDPMFYQRLRAATTFPAQQQALVGVDGPRRGLMHRFFLAYAPTRRLIFRTTRETLREYHRNGLIQDNIPDRDVAPERIPLLDEEWQLYRNVEDHLARHYVSAQENNQQGLGFLLTCYRRRLASSMYALSRSLERRLEGIRSGSVRIRDLVDHEDDLIGVTDLGDEEDTLLEGGTARTGQAEVEIQDLLDDIRLLGGRDSKYVRLAEVLDHLSREHPRVIIFTQYKDTMDYISNRLVEEKTPRVARFSGRGGEIYDPDARSFLPAGKDEIRASLIQEHGTRYLVCTDAASEGLNLQMCGALINYDMPWNPMRVEQRIGRIDRIGQQYPVVRVRNFFYQGTVEDDVYQTLDDRIHLFQRFVGPLQPILISAQKAIQRIAMTPINRRETVEGEALKGLQDQITDAEASTDYRAIEDEFVRKPAPRFGDIAAPVTLQSLQRALLRLPPLVQGCLLRDLKDGTFEIRWADDIYRITFDRTSMDREGETIRLFSYGDPVFDDFLAAHNAATDLQALSLERQEVPGGRVRYLANDGSREIRDLTELLAWLTAQDEHSCDDG